MAAALRILTFNVCFETPFLRERTGALVAFLRRSRYDVAALQELTPEVAGVLRANVGLQAEYVFSPDPPGLPYFTLTLCRKAWSPAFSRTPLTSHMGRDLLTCRLRNGLVVCNVHLESSESQPTRERQLTEIARELQGHADVLLMGDFNFPANHNYGWKPGPLHNDCLRRCLPDMRDAWVDRHGAGDIGHTYLSDKAQWKFEHALVPRNPTARPPRPIQCRFDRIMMRLSGRFRFEDIRITGDTPLPGGLKSSRGFDVYMSDHFALECELGAAAPAAVTALSRSPQVIDLAREEEDDEATTTTTTVTTTSSSNSSNNNNNKRAKVGNGDSAKEKEHILEFLLGDAPSSEDASAHRVGLQFNQRRSQRRFSPDAPVQALYWWAQLEHPELRETKFELRVMTDSGATESLGMSRMEDASDDIALQECHLANLPDEKKVHNRRLLVVLC